MTWETLAQIIQEMTPSVRKETITVRLAGTEDDAEDEFYSVSAVSFNDCMGDDLKLTVRPQLEIED